MVLQALYNVVDSIFVTNMGEKGIIANQALTIAYHIQTLIIAIGVGTGVGLNALLSKSLGEGDTEKANKVAGNGIFLSICIFLVFFIFGIFGSKWFISLFAGEDCIKYGFMDTFIITLIITIVFEIFAKALASLFGLAGGTSNEIIEICTTALRISSLGYIFMGFSIAVQGILQSLRYALKPLIISFLRLEVFVFPIAYLFTLSENVSNIVWWTFPISEILTSIISLFILKDSYKKKVQNI